MSINPDILIKVSYPIDDPESMVIRTNAKMNKLQELIEDYLRAVHVGAGQDDTPPDRDTKVFEITLGFEVSTDSWGDEHNCGNRGLLAGLIMDVNKRLGVGQVKGIKPLSDG